MFPTDVVVPQETPLCATEFNCQPTVALLAVVVDIGVPITRTGYKVTVTVPDLVASCVLVAFTVTDVPISGATRLPAASMTPAEAVHTTPELKPPVPVTDAVQVVDPA